MNSVYTSVCTLHPKVFSACQRKSCRVRTWACLVISRKGVAFCCYENFPRRLLTQHLSLIWNVDAPSTCLKLLSLYWFPMCKEWRQGSESVCGTWPPTPCVPSAVSRCAESLSCDRSLCWQTSAPLQASVLLTLKLILPALSRFPSC